MTSLTLLKAARRQKSLLVVAGAALVVAAIMVSLLVPSHPWVASTIGAGAGLAMLLITFVATRQTVRMADPSVGWFALDLLSKFALIAVALVMAKKLSPEHVLVTALLVVAAAVASAVVQAIAFWPRNPRR